MKNTIKPKVLETLVSSVPGEWTIVQHSEVKDEVLRLVCAAGVSSSDTVRLVYTLCSDAHAAGLRAGLVSAMRENLPKK